MPDETSPTTTEETARSGGHPVAWLSAVAGAVLLVLVAVFVVVAVSGGGKNPTPGEYRVVIPLGTGQRIDQGEAIELIPSKLELPRGTTFVVENHDARAHEVGPFTIRAGETVTFKFTQPGVYKGACTVHPSGEVTLTIV